MKKLIKLFLKASITSLILIGFYGIIDTVKHLNIFTVKNVQIVGVINSDTVTLNTLANTLMGLNVFDSNIEKMMVSNDKWVQKISARRTLPNKIEIVVFEEKVLFDYAVNNRCYSFTANGVSLPNDCSSVQISSEKILDEDIANTFYAIYKNDDRLKSAVVRLSDFQFYANFDDTLFICPYDGKVLDINYKVFIDNIRSRYRTVDYVDLTIYDRVYVKGVLNGSSKG